MKTLAKIWCLFSIHMLISQGVTLDCITKSNSTGTTPGFPEIFLGRCWAFQTTINTDRTCYKNCTELLEIFSSAIENKVPCDVTEADYSPFLDAAFEEIPKDKSLFWEGTYIITHQFSALGLRKVAIAETLAGYVVDNLSWCGQKHSPGFNYKECPIRGQCIINQNYDTKFWIPASKQYAAGASGVVNVILNGTRRDGRLAFTNSSIFALYELPNLNKTKVTSVKAFVVHDIGLPHKENCNNGSLVNLRQKVEELGIPYECQDDPLPLQHLLCVDHPNSPQCTFPQFNTSGQEGIGILALTLRVTITVLIAFFITFFLIL